MGTIALFVIFLLPMGMDESALEKFSFPYNIYFEKKVLDDKDIDNETFSE